MLAYGHVLNLIQTHTDVLDQMIQRQQELDQTYFQSTGSEKADPAANKAARDKYGGYWGPWQDKDEL